MNLHAKRILCVDDERDVLELLCALFAHLGHETVMAASPETALAEAFGRAFDLYVIDTGFPGESGIDLCEALKRRTPQVPVIFYSGLVGEESQEAGVCAGAVAYVPKPRIDELIKTAQRLLQPAG